MKDQLPFQRFGIYGVGLLGGSLGLALKNLYPEIEIIGIGRSEERLQAAVDKGAIDRFTCEPSDLNSPLDALVLCTPVRLVPKVLASALPALKENAIVTDVGSTKATLVRECEKAAEGHCFFVGSHPMAGSHETGVGAADPHLFQKKICIVTESPVSEIPAVETVIGLWQSIGMRVIRMTPEDHDRLTAHSSHLPHLIASALCQTAEAQGPEIEPVLGNGFNDTTRIAQGDPSMWMDICLENRQEILHSLQSFQDVLADLYSRIETADQDAIRDFLTQAQSWKMRKKTL